jgi:hypothetical protein
MTALFSTDNVASIEDIQAAYDELGRQFRTDLYVSRQARPCSPRGPSRFGA